MKNKEIAANTNSDCLSQTVKSKPHDTFDFSHVIEIAACGCTEIVRLRIERLAEFDSMFYC